MTQPCGGGPGLVRVREGGPRAQGAAPCEVQRQTMNKRCRAALRFGHHSDPAAWTLAEWDGWRGLPKVTLREDPQCLGRAVLRSTLCIHLLRLARGHGPASPVGLGDIMSAWSPNSLSVESQCWLPLQPLLVTPAPGTWPFS